MSAHKNIHTLGIGGIASFFENISIPDRKSLVKYEIQFSDLSDIPGPQDSSLTIKLWFKEKQTEPHVIRHWSLIDNNWVEAS